MHKYRILLWRFIKNSVIREMEFSINFLLQLISNTLWFFFTVLFFDIIYHHIKTINGWSVHQTYFLVATNQIIIYLYQSFFAQNFNKFPRLIRTGDLDHLLCKPVDVQFICSVRYFDVKSFLLLPIPCYFLIHSLSQMKLVPSSGQIIMFTIFVLGGVILRYLLGLSIMLLSFLFVEVTALYWMQSEFLRYASYPASIFKNGSRIFFTFLIPVILIANLPAAVILKTIENYQILALFTIFYIFIGFFISRKLFYLCLKGYSSASS
ncbi:MAG TPA: hypothetical protein ENI34_05075 [candidate division WOR-3 bacterium]|uniref:ABC transporter permease n=1 Tax=candidate division WOR-3 bacterium TaxID=2052148 RepID=A0A9C9EM42_UNCW3|nr:hypothetical protein [candidate division WOR-3 bacterium]